MGIIVKLVSSGLGMASEAIHDYRARSHSRSGRDQPPNPAAPSSSRSLAPSSGEAPPAYVEVADEATADSLVRSGKAERVADDKKGRLGAARTGDDDDDSSNDDSDYEEVDDEEAWELDDMAGRVARTDSTGTEPGSAAAAAGQDESEEATAKREELMIRDMLRMCGPPPQPARRIPCPVIIPQRRPRNKDRGFVRAYAPVLEECGIGQDVFLKFMKDWLLASKVCRPLYFFEIACKRFVLTIMSV